jgi:ribosome-binding protein aMBF1 (putative translation factor)
LIFYHLFFTTEILKKEAFSLIVMAECFRCGISGSRARLFDAISNGGIVQVCEKCSEEEDIPVIRRPTTFQLKEAERKHTVYERLSYAAGIKPEEKMHGSSFAGKDKQEISLKEIVDRNYLSKINAKSEPRPDLADNFQWLIMRVRRGKKMTQKQLAEAIGEAEVAVKMAENGVLPEDDNRLIKKIQDYLGISLIKQDFAKQNSRPSPSRMLNFDKESMEKLTISDLKRMKDEKEKALMPADDEAFEPEEGAGGNQGGKTG